MSTIAKLDDRFAFAKCIFWGILGASTLLVFARAQAQDLVVNPGFESGATPWIYTGSAGWDHSHPIENWKKVLA